MAKTRVNVRAKSVSPKAQVRQAMDMEKMLSAGLPKPGGGAGKKLPMTGKVNPFKKKGA